MDIHFTPEELAFRSEVRAFLGQNLPADLAENVRLGRRLAKEDHQRWQKILNQKGWYAVNWPVEHGGTDWSVVQKHIFDEECAAAGAPRLVAFGVNMVAPVIIKFGTQTQKDYYLPRILRSEDWWCQGYSEPGAGSDALGSMATTATRCGDVYKLNGTKIWITNGPVADVLLVYAKTAPELGNRGISAFLVERGFEGFSVAQKLDKMGFRGSPLGELVFEDCVVPAANLLGAEGQGASIMMSGLDLERAWVSVGATGVAQRALDLALEYSQERRQFGAPICSFQLIQAKLANMYTAIESSRLMVLKALDACQAMEAGQAGRGDIHKLCAGAFLASAEACTLCTSEAVQIWGGMGFMRNTEVNRLFRSAKAGEIAGGSVEIRKLIIAGELLKKGT